MVIEKVEMQDKLLSAVKIQYGIGKIPVFPVKADCFDSLVADNIVM
jgi:hypothetical protein